MQGWFILDRANKSARIQYTTNPLIIMVNHSTILVNQIDLEEKTYLPLAKSPLKYIVEPTGNLNNSNLDIKRIFIKDKLYYVQIASNDGSFRQNVFLCFSNDFHLKGWTIVDLNSTTTVDLTDPKFSNRKFNSDIFNVHQITPVNFQDVTTHNPSAKTK